MTTEAAQEWLTVPEIARRLRISRMTAYRLVHSGELVAYRVSNQFRIKPEDYDAYIASARERP